MSRGLGSGDFPGGLVASPAPAQDIPAFVDYVGGRSPEVKGDSFKDESVSITAPSVMAGTIRSAWVRNYRAKQYLEIRLLACLRARRAQYTPTLSNQYSIGGQKPPYFPLAAAKMRAAEAALGELLLPDGERPWGLEPSAIPELEPQLDQAILKKAANLAQQQMVQAFNQGQQMSKEDVILLQAKIHEQEYDAALKAIKQEAKERAMRMEDEIQASMTSGNYYEAMRAFIAEFCTYPTACLKGPFNRKAKRLKWVNNKPQIEEVTEMYWSTVNAFDMYPAPQASSAQDGCFIERMRFTRSDLYQMIGLPGYDENAIRRCLERHTNGNLNSWLWADIERREIENDTADIWKPEYVIDALHYWDSVQGRDLLAHGYKAGEIDPLAYYEVDAILIDNELIRCEINDDPLGRRPYWTASYDPVPGAFWGNSIYELMEDCQDMANASLRAMNYNMGLAAGPIVGVDTSKLADGEDPKAVAPGQIIQMDGSRSTDGAPLDKALIFWQADSRSSEHWAMIDKFVQMADDLTGIPRYTEGAAQAQGAAQTFGGLSMLMSQAAKGFRRAVAVVDRNVIGPTVTAAYEWHMIYGTNEQAKGDCSIVARGAAAVLIKEHLQAGRTQFLQVVLQSPKLQSIIGDEGIRALAQESVKVLDMPEQIVPTSEELQQRVEQQGPPQPTPDAKLKATVQAKKIDSDERAKHANTIAGLIKEKMIHPEAPLPAGLAPPVQTPQIMPNPQVAGAPGQ